MYFNRYILIASLLIGYSLAAKAAVPINKEDLKCIRSSDSPGAPMWGTREKAFPIFPNEPEYLGSTCDCENSLDIYSGDQCTLTNPYPGKDQVFIITLKGSANAQPKIVFRLESLKNSESSDMKADFMLAFVEDCGGNAICRTNSPDFIGSDDEIITLPDPYPPGTYYLYIDSALDDGADKNVSCGLYKLKVTGGGIQKQSDLEVSIDQPKTVKAGDEADPVKVKVFNPLEKSATSVEVMVMVNMDKTKGVTWEVRAPDMTRWIPSTSSTFIWEIPKLDGGESKVLLIDLKVDSATANNAKIHNFADVKNVDQVRINTVDDQDDKTTTVVREADLSVTQVPSTELVVAGADRLNYSLIVTNKGPSDATNVTVRDKLDRDVDYEPTTENCDYNPEKREVECSIDALSAGNSFVQMINVAIKSRARGEIINRVLAWAEEPDPRDGNDRKVVETTVQLKADLQFEETDYQGTAVPGENMTYVITAKNPGPSDVIGARVIDTFPPALTDCQWNCVGSGGAVCPAGSFSDDIDETVDLPATASMTYFVTCRIDPWATGVLENTATILAPPEVIDPTPDDANHICTYTHTLQPWADLSIEKTDEQEEAVPGEHVKYTITVNNEGPSAVRAATVSDKFSETLLENCFWTCQTNDIDDRSQCTHDPIEGDIEGDIEEEVTLPPKGMATYTVDCTIKSSATGDLSNTAYAAGPSGVAESTDTDRLTPETDLWIGKKHTPETVVPGGEVTYTIEVKNENGPSDVIGARVTDTFLPLLKECKWRCRASGAVDTHCTMDKVEGDINDEVNLPVGGIATYSATCMIDSKVTCPIDPSSPNGNVAIVKNEATVEVPKEVEERNDADNSATDEVRPVFALTVITSGSGNGTVESVPTGIRCTDGQDCRTTFSVCTTVELMASADSASTFEGWGGDCSGHGSKTSVTLDSDKTCVAIFSPFTLRVVKAGSGGGTVREPIDCGTDCRIDCGSDCSAQYPDDTEVRLEAIANDDSTFEGWNPECPDGVVTMDADKICVARFNLQEGMNCAEPLTGLVAWWTFDESAGSTTADIAGGHDGTQFNHPTPTEGMVDLALQFDGNDDYVEVADASSLNFGASPDGDFSIVFWIQFSEMAEQYAMTLLEKRSLDGEGKGYQLFLLDGQLGLRLDDGDSTVEPESFMVNLADGAWHFVALTVDRDNPEGGRWYIDGQEAGSAFDLTVVPGSLANLAPLRIGAPIFEDLASPSGPFAGVLDELEIFHRVVSGDEINKLQDAGSLGQCKEGVYVHRDTPVCADAEAGVGILTIRNDWTYEQSYALQFSGIPADECEGAYIDGPTNFELLPPDTAEVAVAGRGRRSVQVEIDRPWGMDADGLKACYQVNVRNPSTGFAFERRASLWDSRRWCAEPVGEFPINQVAGEPTTVTFLVTNTGDAEGYLHYEFVAVPADDEAPSSTVRFNDLEPEESFDAEVRISFEETALVAVETEMLNPQPFAVRDILLREWNSSAILASTGIRNVAEACLPGAPDLCLHGGRFRIRVDWHAEDDSGTGYAVPLTTTTGIFWLREEGDIDVAVKILDGRADNGHWWVFYAVLSPIDDTITITVTDTATGSTEAYVKTPNEELVSVGDLWAFPDTIEAQDAEVRLETAQYAETPAASGNGETLSLHEDRFEIEVSWRDFQDMSGDGVAVPLTADTGYFWFSNDDHGELVVKVIDDRVYCGALTDVEYIITVTDNETYETREYINPLGTFRSFLWAF